MILDVRSEHYNLCRMEWLFQIYMGELDDVALMSELGVAIPPGTHTLLSMSYQVVSTPFFQLCEKEKESTQKHAKIALKGSVVSIK